MDSQDLSLDRISKLPSIIIENILCLVPTKEAVRTSILSKDWRYSWTKIPKLVFTQEDNVFLDAIHQVLSLHTGPLLEFSPSMKWCACGNDVKFDQVIRRLVRKNVTVKKLTLHMDDERCRYSHKLPSSISSLHQLTDLHISGCIFDDDSTLSGIFDDNSTLSGSGSLKSLYVQVRNISNDHLGVATEDEVHQQRLRAIQKGKRPMNSWLAMSSQKPRYTQKRDNSKDALLHFLSSCPLLKHFELAPALKTSNDVVTINELLKCLPVIEHLTIFTWNIMCDRVTGKLPTPCVHLKYFCLKVLFHFENDYWLRKLGFVIRNSPNLEKIKLEINGFSFTSNENVNHTLKDCSDIWLEHLKELEIVGFTHQKAEMELVKLIFAKSPVLMKVKMILNEKVNTDEEMEIKGILAGSPRVSPLAEMIVERRDY